MVHAINLDPLDATALSNRSLCWARLNEGDRASSDAEAAIKLRARLGKGTLQGWCSTQIGQGMQVFSNPSSSLFTRRRKEMN